MRLNAISPSDNPMEELLFCFGGDGDGGDGGGADDGPTAGHPGAPGGDAGERGGGSTGAGGADQGGPNDNDGDGIPNSIDASPGTPGVSAQQAMDNAVGAAIGQAISDFGGSTGPSPGGSGSPGSAADIMGMADLAAQAEKATAGVTDTSAVAAAISAMDDSFGPGGGMTEADVISARTGIPANTMVTDRLGNVVRSGRTNTPVTAGRAVAEAAQALGMTEAQVRGQLNDAGINTAPEAVASPAAQSIAATSFGPEDLMTTGIATPRTATPSTPAEGIVSMARAPADIASLAQTISRDEQAINAAQARNALSGITDVTSMNPQDVDVFGETVAGRGVVQGLGTSPTNVGVTGINPAQSVTETARSPALGTPTADITVTYGQEDLDKAKEDLAAARDEAFSSKQFGFDTGLPESVDLGFATIPTGIGIAERVADAVLDPQASVANAISEIGIATVDGESAEGTANFNPNGLDVVTAGGPVTQGGRTAAYDPNTNIVYDSSPFSGLNPFGEGIPENIQNLYDTRNAIDAAERDRGGEGGGGVARPIIPEEAVTTPEEYQGRNIIGEATGYVPRGPINYAYTGLPSLAPVALRPSFRGRGQYSPLFPVG